MTHDTHNTLHIEEDKHSVLEERSDVDQIVLECEVTEYLKNEVNRFNLHLNFQLRLEMDVVENVKTSIDVIPSFIQKLHEERLHNGH